MKNKNNLLKRICVLFLSACFVFVPFCASGCVPMLLGGNWIEDLNNQLENGEITQEEYDNLFKEYSGGVELEGIKVLRRPESYDYDGNVIDENGNPLTNDYYYLFANNIFLNFNRVYGIINNNYTQDFRAPGSNIFEALNNVTDNGNANLKTLQKLYDGSEDALKYFYDGIRYQIVEEKEVDTNNDSQPDYIEVTADTSKAWAWVKGYDAFNSDLSIESLISSPYFYDNINEVYPTVNGNLVINETKLKFDLNRASSYYSNDINTSTYSSTFANEDFINTLGYAIYCIVLGLKPAEAGFVGGQWIVEGFDAVADNPDTAGVNEGKSSAEVAFESIKATFNKAGSYVGLTQSNKDKIKAYILDEIIGQEAQLYGKQELYYEDVVDAVVEYCGKLTTVGNAGNGDTITNVGDTFIASEIIDYPSTSFFISQNENDPFEQINSHEYQSMIIMPKAELKLTDIWLDFKYLARDGDTVLEDPNLYITINVSVRWFDGISLNVVEKSIKVYNGKIDPGGVNTTLDFELDSKEAFGKPVTVGKFTCDPINATLNSEFKDEKTGFDVMTLTGMTTARHYYQVINSKTYGGYGVINQEKISSENPGMSYLEIAFEVEKAIGDFSTNHDFYVGFSQLHYEEQDLSWVK